MSRRLIIRPAAERDLSEARDWYEAQRPGLGVEFLTAVDERFEHIMDFPESYAVEYQGVRPAGLRRFPYVVAAHFRCEILVAAVSCGFGRFDNRVVRFETIP